MKKIFLFLLLIFTLICGGAFSGLYLIAIPKIENSIQAQLKEFGHSDIKIENLSADLNGIHIEKIVFGPDLFNLITDMKAQLSWPQYILSGTVNSLIIEEMHLVSLNGRFKNFANLKNKLHIKKIAAIPAKHIKIKKLLWDTTSGKSALRIEGVMNVQQQDQSHIVQADITAQQHQLNFSSHWIGKIDQNQNLQLDGKFSEFGIHYGPLQINRGAGWIAYKETAESSALSGQMEAGSGKLFSVPANQISITLGQENDYYPLLFRAEASGIKGVRLSTDMHHAQDKNKEALKSVLKITDLQAFTKHLEILKLITPTQAKAIKQQGATDVIFSYLPEKRFADGPAPFDLSILNKDKKILSGTFLIYPNSLDIRGTAQGNDEIIQTLRELSLAKEENITEETIRFDGNIKSVLLSNTY